jgi:hypothetical protein
MQIMNDAVEWHLPGMRYCGPGTNLELCLQPDGKTPKVGWEPVDRIDEAALHHDLYYSQHPSQRERAQVGDKLMIDEITSINNPTCREAFERAIVLPILRLKRFFTLLILNLIDWLCRRHTTSD